MVLIGKKIYAFYNEMVKWMLDIYVMRVYVDYEVFMKGL